MFYGIIGVVGIVLKQCPKVPKAVNMGFGVVLATIAGGLGFVPLACSACLSVPRIHSRAKRPTSADTSPHSTDGHLTPVRARGICAMRDSCRSVPMLLRCPPLPSRHPFLLTMTPVRDRHALHANTCGCVPAETMPTVASFSFGGLSNRVGLATGSGQNLLLHSRSASASP